MVTLAEVEADVQSRAGPFANLGASGGTATTILVDDLRSSIPLGGWEDLWVLRRGVTGTGDRQRRIQTYDPTTGTLTVDRAYAVPPAVAEPLEIGVLDPAQQLRPAVVAGLERCFFVDRVRVPVVAGNVEQSLSDKLFWVADPGWVRYVGAAQGDWGTAGAWPLGGYDVVAGARATSVAVDCPPCGDYVVEALRPHATWINGADVRDWAVPADGDELAVNVRYAAAAGHVEAWRRSRVTLGPPAAAGYADGRETAERVFSQMVRQQHWFWDRPDYLSFGPSRGSGRVAGATWHQVEDRHTWRGLSAETWRHVLETIP